MDSEMAKRDGHLMPQQMYEAVKRYETYVARNKRLDGKGAVASPSPPKTTGQSSGYKLGFTKRPLLSPLPVGWTMSLTPLRVPRPQRNTAPWRLTLPLGKMRGCTSLASLRR